MEFDPDRLAKLAGISGAEPVSTPKPAAKQAPAASGLIRESAAPRRRSPESKEVRQLRQLIRTEASQVIREMRAERRALAEGDLTRLQTRRSLNEAVAMGFYGPGFAGGNSGRPSRLFENESGATPSPNELFKALLDAGAIEALGLDAADVQANKKDIIAAAEKMQNDPKVIKAAEKVNQESASLEEGEVPQYSTPLGAIAAEIVSYGSAAGAAGAAALTSVDPAGVSLEGVGLAGLAFLMAIAFRAMASGIKDQELKYYRDRLRPDLQNR